MYRLNQTESAFSYNFDVINASEGSLCFQILYFTTAGVKCRVAAVKSCPVLHFSVVIFSGSSGSLMPALLSAEN
jgi:hypothetical protein